LVEVLVMLSPLQPIPTNYRGYRFRSRLEARWAVFFDAAGIRYDFEPEGFLLPDGTPYLPDFWLPDAKMWAEVKPNDHLDKVVVPVDALSRLGALALGSDHPALLLDGPPRDTNYWAAWPDHAEPVGWDWQDLYLSDGYYHGDLGRFYISTGMAYFPDHAAEGTVFGSFNGEMPPAVKAARSARFEYEGRAR
jgi:hypothetical protein